MAAMNYDNHNRFRSKTVAFRVSPEEDKQIERAVALTGMTKQDYITSKLIDKTIVVQGNCKIHRAVMLALMELSDELKRIEAGAGVDEELMDEIRLVTGIIDRLYI